MKAKVQISKINIKIGDKEIPLSLEEARELRQVLDDLLGDKLMVASSYPVIIREPVYHPRPYWYWEPSYICGPNTAGTLTIGNTGNSGHWTATTKTDIPYTLTSGNADPAPMPVS